MREYIENNTLRCEAGYRGGGIEISLAELLKADKYEDYCMTAYQNYLGGGMLGSIGNSYNFDLEALPKTQKEKVEKITDELNRYYHELTNHDDEWENTSYERGQLRPESAY
jgi:hypothetical protein